MASYTNNHERAAYEAASANHAAVYESWQQSEAQRQSDYEAAHAAWEQYEVQSQADYAAAHDAWEQNPTTPEGDPIPEPQPPEPVPEPPAPEPTPGPQPPPEPSVYESREVSEPEEIETPGGPALVLPPRIVLTAADGTLAALSAEELAAAYTAVTPTRRRAQ